jgi:hypothetical protein
MISLSSQPDNSIPKDNAIMLKRTFNIPSLFLSTECYIKRAHLTYVVIATSIIVTAEDRSLETDVCSVNSGMDAADHHKVLHQTLSEESSFHVILCQLLLGSHSIATIKASSLVGISVHLQAFKVVCCDHCNKMFGKLLVTSHIL